MEGGGKGEVGIVAWALRRGVLLVGRGGGKAVGVVGFADELPMRRLIVGLQLRWARA